MNDRRIQGFGDGGGGVMISRRASWLGSYTHTHIYKF